MLFLKQNIQHWTRAINGLWLAKWPLLATIVTIVCCCQLLLLYTIIMQQPGGIIIEDVVLTSDISETGFPVDRFPDFSQDNDRIYCFILTKESFGPPLSSVMLVKWYYGAEQIASDYFHVNTAYPATVWLDSPANEPFRQGNYTVEIFIQDKLVRILEFEVQ